jgi:quinoprotein glucose dehydrogenase
MAIRDHDTRLAVDCRTMTSRFQWCRRAAALASCVLLAGSIAACREPGATATASRGASWNDWPVYAGGPDSVRYSGLTQITTANVTQLKVAWTFESGDAYPGSELQCNPLIIDGVLYATTPKVNVVALDAATGTLRWRFDPHDGRKVLGKLRNRGLTYWADAAGHDARLFVAVRQFLYAIDAHTGKPIPSFGTGGRIDLRDHLGRDPKDPAEQKDMVSLTTPGVVYKDLLIMGSLISETLPAAPGDIRAIDVRTGALRWSFHTIPHPGEFGADTWPKDAWTYLGAANDWAGLSLDAQRGLVFVPTGSAAYDFYGANRTGDNLFANSLIALKADTGQRVWHFQTVHHDIWDRDLPATPALITVMRDGHPIDAVAQVTKSGYVFVFDRTNGTPLFPIEERKVPSSDLDGEMTAATQPFPLKPEAFARQRLTADMLTQRTPAAHAEAVKRFSTFRSAGQFVPPSREGSIIFPGFDGGAEWGGPAFDRETGLLYVNANEMAWILRMVPPTAGTASKTSAAVSGKTLYTRECASCHKADLSGGPPEFPSLIGVTDRYTDGEIGTLLAQGSGRMPAFSRLGPDGIRALVRYVTTGRDTVVAQKGPSPMAMKWLSDGYNKFLDSEGYPAVQPPWGTLNAIDLNSGAIAWKIPLGTYPALAATGQATTGSENYGGPIVTAGGLVFIGATSFDKKFHAFDKRTGALLWETTLPSAGNATPATYVAGGRQFVVIAAGGGKSADPTGGSYVAFALPQ